MKNLNAFLTLGLIGCFVTLILHIFMLFTQNVKWDYMFTYYIVWIVFLILGLAQQKRKNKLNV